MHSTEEEEERGIAYFNPVLFRALVTLPIRGFPEKKKIKKRKGIRYTLRTWGREGGKGGRIRKNAYANAARQRLLNYTALHGTLVSDTARQ